MWDDVRQLLAGPDRIQAEYERRLSRQNDESLVREQEKRKAALKSLQRGIDRLIDAYADGLLVSGGAQTPPPGSASGPATVGPGQRSVFRPQGPQNKHEGPRRRKTVRGLCGGAPGAPEWLDRRRPVTLLEKGESEPKVEALRRRKERLERERESKADEAALRREMRLVVGQLQEFAERVQSGLDAADWETQRAVICALVKRIEVERDNVRIVYRVNAALPTKNRTPTIAQDCLRRSDPI